MKRIAERAAYFLCAALFSIQGKINKVSLMNFWLYRDFTYINISVIMSI